MPRNDKQREPTKPTPPAALADAEALFEEDPACGRALAEVLGGGLCGLRQGHEGLCKRAAPAVQTELGGPIPGAPDVKKRPVKMELLVELTNDELLDCVQTFARLHADLGAHESHSSAVKADLKAKETRLNDEISKLAEKVRLKKELREVVVERVVDFGANAYYEVRTDSGTEIPGSRRALSTEERQRELGLPVPDKRKNSVELVEAAKASELAPPTNSGRFALEIDRGEDSIDIGDTEDGP